MLGASPPTPFLIGVSGGAASGKVGDTTFLVEKSEANGKQAIVLSLSTFYRQLSAEDRNLAENGKLDLDHPLLIDVCERKRNLNTVLENYFNFVKPAFEEFCLPTKKYADVILPRAPDNVIGVELIIEHLLQMMTTTTNTSVQRLRFRNQSESATGCIRPH
ncbi:UMP-CMP kinase [Sparganum proliferum]